MDYGFAPECEYCQDSDPAVLCDECEVYWREVNKHARHLDIEESVAARAGVTMPASKATPPFVWIGEN